MDSTSKFGKYYHKFSAYDLPKLIGGMPLPDIINKNQCIFCIVDRDTKTYGFVVASRINREKFQIAYEDDILLELSNEVSWVMTEKDFKKLKAKDIPELLKKAKEHYGIEEGYVK